MPKRRRFSPEYKARLVLELISGQRSAAEIARKEHIKDTMLYEWRAQFLEHAPEVFSSPQADQESEQRIVELEHIIGQLTIENQILKKASRWLSGMSKRNGNSPGSS
jgi:transposase-like protein